MIRVEDLGLAFRLQFHHNTNRLKELFTGLLSPGKDGSRSKLLWALDGVSFEVAEGETVGVIGSNGAGKSTLLRVLAGIYRPDRGRVMVRGNISCLLNFTVGFNFSLSGRENIYISGAVLGIPRAVIDEKLNEVIDFADIREFIDAPVKSYSTGMRSRLGFSIAINVDPDVLLLDEVISAGDAAFQKKAGSILGRFQERGKTVVAASHSLGFVRQSCSRAIWIERGKVMGDGEPDPVVQQYLESRKQG